MRPARVASASRLLRPRAGALGPALLLPAQPLRPPGSRAAGRPGLAPASWLTLAAGQIQGRHPRSRTGRHGHILGVDVALMPERYA